MSADFNAEFAKTVGINEADPATMLQKLIADGHEFDACAWYYRKLAAIRPIRTSTDLGKVVLRGYKDGADQEPVSLVAVESTGKQDEAWWHEVERFLSHVQRVLSFACGVYLLPVYEQRFRAGRMTLRVAQRSRAPTPYLAPFRDLFMEEVFGCAISFVVHYYAERARSAKPPFGHSITILYSTSLPLV